MRESAVRRALRGFDTGKQLFNLRAPAVTLLRKLIPNGDAKYIMMAPACPVRDWIVDLWKFVSFNWNIFEQGITASRDKLSNRQIGMPNTAKAKDRRVATIETFGKHAKAFWHRQTGMPLRIKSGRRFLPIYRLVWEQPEKVDVKTKKPANDRRVFQKVLAKRP